ncbi:HAD domain-containing protein [Micromonospora sp. CPCC 206061]|uniref:HAD domain-containing protein n=1 Tax=Micromonospora sp. CPCC 206061 TaxID=3122410 RepID=UPI002FF24F76
MPIALVLDVDGVVCPASGFSPFGELVEVGIALQPVLVAPALCAALTNLAAPPDVTPAWLTSWLPQTRQAMRSPFPGHAWEQIELEPGGDGWPKWSALNAWLARNPQITRLAWVDDDLTDRAPLYTKELRRRGLDALMIAPATDYGMTPHHVARLNHWCARHTL